MSDGTEPAGPNPPSDLDLSVLDRLVGHNSDRFRKYAVLFVRSIEDVLGQIDTAMPRGDLQALAEMGHRAKSTSLNVGAVGFSAQCLLLERAAKDCDAATALAIARGLRPRFDTIRDVIEHRLAA